MDERVRGRSAHSPSPGRVAPKKPANLAGRILASCLPAAISTAVLSVFSPALAAAPQTLVHGLWVWKTLSVLQAPEGPEKLRDFCLRNHVSEVYLSVSERATTLEDHHLTDLVGTLHRSGLQVDALLSSPDADEPGRPREKLLDEARQVLSFNKRHPECSFDGIHLDIEPQQREENKGEGNLRFLPGLVAAYRAMLQLTGSERIGLNADIARKFLKGGLEERRMLLSALPRLTLMLYELGSPNDLESAAKRVEKLQKATQESFQEAYAGLDDINLARLGIGLRTPDYGELLPRMLQTLDDANRTNPHYLGWGWHSYNDH